SEANALDFRGIQAYFHLGRALVTRLTAARPTPTRSRPRVARRAPPGGSTNHGRRAGPQRGLRAPAPRVGEARHDHARARRGGGRGGRRGSPLRPLPPAPRAAARALRGDAL